MKTKHESVGDYTIKLTIQVSIMKDTYMELVEYASRTCNGDLDLAIKKAFFAGTCDICRDLEKMKGAN